MRIVGFLMLFAQCLVFYAACIAVYALSWIYGVVGAALFFACFGAAWLCFEATE